MFRILQFHCHGKVIHTQMNISWNSLVVPWLGLHTCSGVARVQFLVRELGSLKPRSMGGKKSRCFPGGPVVKNPLCNARDASLIPGPGRSLMLRSK